MTETKSYHRYVFDIEKRRFVGDFETMYQAEAVEGFDSWHQDSDRQWNREFALALLSEIKIHRVLDVGCGKAMFTSRLYQAGRQIVGIDISPTAIGIAQERVPDAVFMAADLGDPERWPELELPFDLVVCLEVLSYLDQWREVVRKFSEVGRYALIVLYLPEQPIGFIKTHDELAEEFAKRFRVIHDIRLRVSGHIILVGESKASAG